MDGNPHIVLQYSDEAGGDLYGGIEFKMVEGIE